MICKSQSVLIIKTENKTVQKNVSWIKIYYSVGIQIHNNEFKNNFQITLDQFQNAWKYIRTSRGLWPSLKLSVTVEPINEPKSNRLAAMIDGAREQWYL